MVQEVGVSMTRWKVTTIVVKQVCVWVQTVMVVSDTVAIIVLERASHTRFAARAASANDGANAKTGGRN